MDDYRQNLTVSSRAVAERDCRIAQENNAAWERQANETTIVLIDRRAMYRECFSQYLSFAIAARVLAFATVEDWLDAGANVCASLIILVHAQSPDHGRLRENIRRMTQDKDCAPLFVLSDLEDDDGVDAILRSGVRGYVSTNFTMDVIVKAVRMVCNGGVFAPMGAIAETTRASPRDVAPPREFTPAGRVGGVSVHQTTGRGDRSAAQGQRQQGDRL